jgi:hypothetical protein
MSLTRNINWLMYSSNSISPGIYRLLMIFYLGVVGIVTNTFKDLIHFIQFVPTNTMEKNCELLMHPMGYDLFRQNTLIQKQFYFRFQKFSLLVKQHMKDIIQRSMLHWKLEFRLLKRSYPSL